MITARQASVELARSDVLADGLLRRHGPVVFRPRPPVAGRFHALARAITYQQLAGRAAASIWARLVEAAGVDSNATDQFLTARDVMELGVLRLRACGLSEAKALGVTDLAEHCLGGAIRLESLGRMGDDEVIAELTRVRGIGVWTAEMFLMGGLHRLDVWPTGDLGVRNGLGLILGLDRAPTTGEMAPLGEPYRPYRSVLASWCWREVELSRSEA